MFVVLKKGVERKKQEETKGLAQGSNRKNKKRRKERQIYLKAFLVLVVRPGAPRSVLVASFVPSSDALCS